MPSSLITFPEHNQDITPNTSFDITIKTTNMELGHFTNAQLTYYSAPTRLNGAGLIIGHTHITCQVTSLPSITN
jgi:transcription initiation factor TFIID subunit 15